MPLPVEHTVGRHDGLLRRPSHHTNTGSSSGQSPERIRNPALIRHPKQEVRQMTWNKAVKEVAEAGHEGAVIRRLQKLLAT